MLSSTADHLFWMARYVERAENTARMLDANLQSSLLPQAGSTPGEVWHTMLSLSELKDAYLARHAPPQQVQDLALHNCLTYTYFGKSLWEFLGPDGPESVPVSGNLSANISNLLLAATLDGAGISLQPAYSVHPHLASGALVPLLTPWQPKRLGVYAVYGTRKQMSPLLRSFLDFLVERMADDPLWQEAPPSL